MAEECFFSMAVREGRDPQRAYDDWEEQQLLRHGWFVHMVMSEPGSPWINAHTHNLPEKFGHPDLQIVLPLPSNTIMHVLHSAVDLIREGREFAFGVDHDKVIRNLPVRACEGADGARPVIRILFPDATGKFPGDAGCAEVYSDQAAAVV